MTSTQLLHNTPVTKTKTSARLSGVIGTMMTPRLVFAEGNMQKNAAMKIRTIPISILLRIFGMKLPRSGNAKWFSKGVSNTIVPVLMKSGRQLPRYMYDSFTEKLLLSIVNMNDIVALVCRKSN